MPYVNNPPNHSPHNHTMTKIGWVNNVTPVPYSYKVELGSAQGDSDIYPGREVVGLLYDDKVQGLPGGGTKVYTNVKYKKVKGGAWYGGTEYTDFTCN